MEQGCNGYSVYENMLKPFSWKAHRDISSHMYNTMYTSIVKRMVTVDSCRYGFIYFMYWTCSSTKVACAL